MLPGDEERLVFAPDVLSVMFIDVLRTVPHRWSLNRKPGKKSANRVGVHGGVCRMFWGKMIKSDELLVPLLLIVPGCGGVEFGARSRVRRCTFVGAIPPMSFLLERKT